jgi:hypothetical protein
MAIIPISDLVELTTPADGDELVIRDVSEALPINQTKRITIVNALLSKISESIFTAVGDILYATGSATPAVLAKPVVNSVLQNTSAGALSWKALTDFTTSVIYRRQGGSSTVWATGGLTTYTPTAPKIQTGAASGSYDGSATVDIYITFPAAFSYAPIVLAFGSPNGAIPLRDQCYAVSASGFTYRVVYTATSGNYGFYWMAIGE